MRYALEQAVQPETVRARQTIAQNVARYAVDQLVETQRQTSQLVDQVTRSLTAAQDATVELTAANSRLAQTGFRSLNGVR